MKLYDLPQCGKVFDALNNTAISESNYNVNELVYKACNTAKQDTLSYSVLDTGFVESLKCNVGFAVNQELPVGTLGQVCVDPSIVFDPITQATYSLIVQKAVAKDAVTCSNKQTCLDSGLRSYNSNVSKTIGINQPFGSVGQICANPDAIFDPTSQALYNITTQKSTAKDAVVCKSTEVCVNSDNGATPPVPTINEASSFDWISFTLGTVTGALGVIAVAGISYAIYKFFKDGGNCHQFCAIGSAAPYVAPSEAKSATTGTQSTDEKWAQPVEEQPGLVQDLQTETKHCWSCFGDGV